MKIIAFPGSDSPRGEQAWLDDLEAALNDEREGADADYWRELRGDVRALAPPIADEFAHRLEGELSHTRRVFGRFGRGSRRTRRRATPTRPRVALLAGFGAAVLAAAVAAVIFGQPRPAAEGVPHSSVAARPGSGGSGVGSAGAGAGAASRATEAPSPGASTAGSGEARASSATNGAAVPFAPTAPTPGREQQLAATVSLSASPANVQAVSDGVARLAEREEGYVEESHTQVQAHGSSEASLTLQLPSARLGAALAAIARLAPVGAESQSLQDITNSYDAARQRLADANAERQALLKALARASTEGQIASLRERLAQARSSVAHARSALEALTRHASTAEVEVTVLGDASAAAEGLTLHRGLHDAGRVLTVVAVVALIAAAVLVPLALVAAVLVGVAGAWRRRRREHALDSA